MIGTEPKTTDSQGDPVTVKMHRTQSHINHVALVLDASSSMDDHESKVIEVADEQIRTLAMRSEELGQETRVSVYTFANEAHCVLFDMDVMRLPSIADLYEPAGMTALVDAAWKSHEDLSTTSQIYGDHAFLTFVITDGQENRSRRAKFSLGTLVSNLPAGHSMGFLVPQDGASVHYLTRLGVPKDMIAEWDTVSADGFVGAGAKVKAATESFMTMRAAGQSVTRSAFSTGAEAVNTATVSAALDPLALGTYTIAANRTPNTQEMKDFVESNGLKYRHGTHYYELGSTRALVQPVKNIVVVNRKTQQAYSDSTPGSPRVRDLIGLSKTERTSVSATANKDWTVFVQSTATNRHIKTGMSAFTLDPQNA